MSMKTHKAFFIRTFSMKEEAEITFEAEEGASAETIKQLARDIMRARISANPHFTEWYDINKADTSQPLLTRVETSEAAQ